MVDLKALGTGPQKVRTMVGRTVDSKAPYLEQYSADSKAPHWVPR